MHIGEGILHAPILVTTTAAAAAGVAVGLRRVRPENLSECALLASAFFVASLIHVPLFGTNAHLILNGLMGLILGWAAFPVILVALTMQVLLFQYGGFTTLGLNTLIMAVPAVATGLIFGRWIRQPNKTLCIAASVSAGFFSVLLSGILGALALYFGGEAGVFTWIAGLIAGAHLPIAVVEGAITASAILFLRQVHPHLLSGLSAADDLAIADDQISEEAA